MKRVEQRRTTDCGVACVATVAGITYEEAEAAMGEAARRRTEVADLRMALAKFGYGLGHRSVTTTQEKLCQLTFDCLLKTEPGPKTGNWHWMVWDSGVQDILDPLSKHRAYKQPEMRVSAYIQIKKLSWV